MIRNGQVVLAEVTCLPKANVTSFLSNDFVTSDSSSRTIERPLT